MKNNTIIDRFKKPAIGYVVIFLFVYAIYFSFGFHHISNFITADEHFWVNQRIYTYWHSLTSPSQWPRTQLSDKPGITVALVSGIGLFKESNPFAHMKAAATDAENSVKVTQSVYTIFRIPMLIFNALFSLYLFWIVKKLTGNFWIGFWSFILILLSPILLGISQITNADAVMWSFSCATLLSFLAYLKTEEKKFLALSPLFLGLSLLTKLVAVIFFPFLFLATLIFIILKVPDWQKNKIEITAKIRKISIFYLTTLAGSLLLFALLMPASLINREVFFEYTIGYAGMDRILLFILALLALFWGDAIFFKSSYLAKICQLINPYFKNLLKAVPTVLILIFLIVITNWNFSQFILNPAGIIDYTTHELEFLKSSSCCQQLIYQFYYFIFALTPLVILASIFIWIKRALKAVKNSFLIDILSIFILVFYLALIAQGLPATVRYSIVLYPLASIIAAFGIYEFFSLKRLEKIKKVWISLGIIGISLISLWAIKPFYFNYANDLLPKKYPLSGSWGYGGYEAAQFLNSLPDAQNLKVWADYYGFRNFFIGSGATDYIIKKSSPPIDYYVLTMQGRASFNYWCNKNKSICRGYVPVNKYYDRTDPVWELDIGGRPGNFIKIFKAEE